jgi:hypothetical protein
MASYCVNIKGISDEILEQFGYRLIDENDEFKRYEDKYMEPHLVEKAWPLLYVEDMNDHRQLSDLRVVELPEGY